MYLEILIVLNPQHCAKLTSFILNQTILVFLEWHNISIFKTKVLLQCTNVFNVSTYLDVFSVDNEISKYR